MDTQTHPHPLREHLPPQAQRAARHLLSKGADAGIPCEPLLGRLPLARVIPQDVHSLADYADALTVMAVGWTSADARLRAAGTALGLAVGGVSALTDYHLSLAKLIPIEVHEVLDHVWGASTAATPFLLGTWRKAPVASAVMVAVGLGTIAASLFTDYCADKGVKWRKHLKTDLGPVGA